MKGYGFGGISSGLRYYEYELDSLDSSQSVNQNTSRLNTPLFFVGGKKPIADVAAVKIVEAEIPVSFYLFNSRNNQFTITESGYGSKTVTIPEGNYSYVEMITALQTLLSPTGVGTHWTYTVTYSSTTGKFTFATNNTGGGAVTEPFSFTFGTDTTDRGWTNPRLWLGFPGGVTDSQTFSTTTGDVLVAPFVANLAGPNYLYLCSSKLGNLTNIYLPRGSAFGGNSGPQVAKIPIPVNPGDVVFWQDPDVGKYFDLENLQSIYDVDFYLTAGTDPTPLDLNGQSFSLKMAMILYEFDATDISHGSVQQSKVLKRLRLT